MSPYFTIRWQDGVVRMLDQRQLPHRAVYLELKDHLEVAAAIHHMAVRGAPAIGAAAAYGMALAGVNSMAQDVTELRAELKRAAAELQEARPTAVNLAWALRRMLARAQDASLDSLDALRQAMVAEAQQIAEEDVRTNRQIGLNGLEVVPDKANIAHHCNTGSLATVDYGTALGVIRAAHEHGKQVHVYVDETRPRLQGARLTSWELLQLGVPHTIIVDGASGSLMRQGKVDLCLVGCDRIAANGDTANKIGTYNLALAAHAHNIPFYVVGPTSTIDLATPTGDDIPIEHRPVAEVVCIGEESIAPQGADVANPAFDVTPARFITAIITERGIARPPYRESLAALFSA